MRDASDELRTTYEEESLFEHPVGLYLMEPDFPQPVTEDSEGLFPHVLDETPPTDDWLR